MMRFPDISRLLSLQRPIGKIRCADRLKEILMDIIAIQVVATGALLVAHLTIVVRNRITGRL
jgi:hypothetical protein